MNHDLSELVGGREVAQRIMPTLGEELKRRREERQITLAEISEATRIGTRFLKAIESDNFSPLPGGIFTRSFIRAYAREVGMDQDEAIARYHLQVTGSQEPQDSQTAEPEPVVLSPPRIERSTGSLAFRQAPSRANWATIIITAGILVFIAIIIYALVSKLNEAAIESGQQTSAGPVAQPEPPQPAAVQAAESGEPNAASTADSAPAALPQGGSIKINLAATSSECWVRYQVDEREPNSLTVRPGMSLDLPPAQSQVKLNIGDRTTLKIKINDREAAFPPGTQNFGAQIVVSRDNLQSFFPRE